MSLAETISLGINNPDCAFFVGNYTGMAFGVKLLFFGYLMYVISRVVDKLVLEPILEWIKKKMNK